MHPFCLPFGFCHDATSSSLNNNDFNAQQNSNGDANNTISNQNNSNNNNKDKLNRSTSASPSTDELFRQLNNNTSASLLNEDDIIIGSSTIGIGGSCVDVESFYSLELDLNGISEDSDVALLDGTNEDGAQLTAFTDEDDLLDDDVNFIAASVADDEEDDLVISRNGTIDWYSSSCTKYSSLSLFSPTSNNNKSSTATKNGRRKSLIRQALLTGCNANGTASHIHHNQVFHQHVVDPIDIKSSPTLAQLNLNSINDDPTDPWMDLPPPPGTNGAISSSTSILSSSTNHHHSSQDLLLSNSTSILNNHQHHPHHHHHHHHHHNHHSNHSLRSNAANNGGNCTCNHLNNHAHSNDSIHHQQQSAHLKSLSSSPLTSHHHQHNHDHQQPSTRFNCNNSNNGPNYHQPHHATAQMQHHGSTCMAASSPFGRTDLNVYHQPYSTTPCCQHNHHELINTEKTIYGNNLNLHQNCNNLKSSSSMNQLNQLTQQQKDSLLTTATSCTKTCLDEKQKLDQQRSASPALVTSSSSPLSTSTQHPLGAATTLTLAGSTVIGASVNSNRMIDNKLKENIEYLTALLCDGNNKFDNNGLLQTQVQQQHQQQPQPQHPPQQPATTTSTMARSYATLAQSLSTGPKLLERQQLGLNNPQQQQHLQKLTGQLPQHLHCSLPNEASPCSHNNLQQQLPLNSTNNTQQSNTLKRPFSETSANDQWFGNKQLPVETSVSAADSTDGHFSSLSNDKLVQNQNLECSRQKTNELKVLSSLLNSTNKPLSSSCAGHQSNTTPVQSVYSANTPVWQSSIPSNNLISVSGAELSNTTGINSLDKGLPPTIATLNISAQPQIKVQLDSSIPLNGKPITLTPITNQASLIKQQQQQARNSLFIQPASPSASSTASSSNTTNDPANLSSSVAPVTNTVKKQKTNITNAQTLKGGTNTNSSGNRAARPNSMSTDCSLSSHDEGFSSQVDNDDNGSMHDSDDDDDVDSDDESFYGDYTNNDLIGASISDNAENKWTLNMGRTRRNGQKRYFWQYNVQSKGPKGTRICSTDDSEDPFVLPEASDPVFSNDCQVEGVKHSGKARRGDGNDLTPNPRKLLMIGLELKKLGKIINDLAPVTDLPINARNKTRKEKNKLASRACRLKKKAQHEANKIKLYGLQREHQQVVLAIYDIRKLLNAALLERDTKESLLNGDSSKGQNNESCEQKLVGASTSMDFKNIDSTVKIIAEKCSMNVAGQTSDYVNSVLEKVVSGCIDGGLQT